MTPIQEAARRSSCGYAAVRSGCRVRLLAWIGHVEGKSLEFRHLVDFAQDPSVVLAGGAVPSALVASASFSKNDFKVESCHCFYLLYTTIFFLVWSSI